MLFRRGAKRGVPPSNPFISLRSSSGTGNPLSQEDGPREEEYDVNVTMKISKHGRDVETKTIDFGMLKESQVKGLTDLFSMMAANVEYIKKLSPQFEKLEKGKPTYLQ